MTMLRDQLSSLADSVEVPPAPSLFELERDAGPARRSGRVRLVAAVAATLALVGGSAYWLSRGADDKPEPVGPPTWSDVDVPWTADGKLHWRDAVIDVEPLTAYAVTGDGLYLLHEGELTQILPNGHPITIATDVQGPVAVDADGTSIAWSNGRRLMGHDSGGDIDPTNDTTYTGSRDYPDALLTALDGNRVWGIAAGKPFQSWIGDHTSVRPPGYRPPVTFASRAGWLVVTDDRQRLRALSDEGGTLGLGRGEVVDIGPAAEYVAFEDSRGEVVMTALPSGVRTPLGLPAGSSPGDFGYRWTSDGDLVMPVTTEPDTKDSEVSWYLCSAPDWGCEAMDVPDQPRSEIPLSANFWTFTAIADVAPAGLPAVVTTITSASASAPAAPETSGQ